MIRINGFKNWSVLYDVKDKICLCNILYIFVRIVPSFITAVANWHCAALCKKMIGACYCHKANRGHCIRKYSLIYLHRVRTHRALGSEHGVVDVEGAGAGAGQSCTSHLFDRQCLLFWLLTLFVFLSRKLSPRGFESSSAARWSDRLM